MSVAAFSPKTISAVQQIRKMRGGSQSHLMRADDGAFYVVKFQNNPQHVRILANEFFGSRIGSYLGLPMPDVAVIGVCDWLITHTPDLRIIDTGRETLCSSGLQLGSRYVADPENTVVADYLPESVMVKNARIAHHLASSLVFDKWTGNADGRQAVFTKPAYARSYEVVLIDQGYCFNAGSWDFPDRTLVGTFYRNFVYEHATGWESFEPILSRAEQIDQESLWKLAEGMPQEWWYQHTCGDLHRLIETLYQRRSKIRDLITDFRHSTRNPFPNWAGN